PAGDLDFAPVSPHHSLPVSNRDTRMCGRWIPLVGIAFALLAGSTAGADEVSEFYRGRTVTLIVTNPPGGGYDLPARTKASFIPKHLLAPPTLPVQTIPGPAGTLGTNHPSHPPPKDGSVLGTISNPFPFDPLLGTAEARFDPLQFNWIGSPTVETGLLGVWHTVPVNSIDEAKTRELTIASNGPRSTPTFYARLLNETL